MCWAVGYDGIQSFCLPYIKYIYINVFLEFEFREHSDSDTKSQFLIFKIDQQSHKTISGMSWLGQFSLTRFQKPHQSSRCIVSGLFCIFLFLPIAVTVYMTVCLRHQGICGFQGAKIDCCTKILKIYVHYIAHYMPNPVFFMIVPCIQ